ncbi:MAG TPA: transposase, partial [Propionicimonas sp.]
MPRQPRQLADSRLYHVMLRGVNRDAIFLEDADYQRFLDAFRLVKEVSGCLVLAYCLMTNHVHVVMMTTTEPISLVMKRLGVRYVGWFNRKYGRVGHLFQSRFASLPVEDDAYLITLLRYVWRNPVEAGMVLRPEDYRWSSRSTIHRDTSLVDASLLQRLVPSDVLGDPGLASDAPPPFVTPRIGRPTLHTDEEVAVLLHRCCGARGPEDFGALGIDDQRQAIRELRARSASYSQ